MKAIEVEKCEGYITIYNKINYLVHNLHIIMLYVEGLEAFPYLSHSNNLHRASLRLSPKVRAKSKLYVTIFMLCTLPSHFVCPLFHFGMFQNIVMFLKIKVINLLMFLLYPY